MRRNRVAEEKITVDAYSGYRGEEAPRKFIFRGNEVEVVEILRAWIEEGCPSRVKRRFFEVKGSDGLVNRFYFDEDKTEWFYDVDRGDKSLSTNKEHASASC